MRALWSGFAVTLAAAIVLLTSVGAAIAVQPDPASRPTLAPATQPTVLQTDNEPIDGEPVPATPVDSVPAPATTPKAPAPTPTTAAPARSNTTAGPSSSAGGSETVSFTITR